MGWLGLRSHVNVGCRQGVVLVGGATRCGWPLVNSQGRSVGLDVYARWVVGCGLEGETGRVFERRLTPEHREVLAWIATLPPPAVVRYEAGPAGFGVVRSLARAGIECVVAAPSTVQRPSGIG
jgi:transposase